MILIMGDSISWMKKKREGLWTSGHCGAACIKRLRRLGLTFNNFWIQCDYIIEENFVGERRRPFICLLCFSVLLIQEKKRMLFINHGIWKVSLSQRTFIVCVAVRGDWVWLFVCVCLCVYEWSHLSVSFSLLIGCFIIPAYIKDGKLFQLRSESRCQGRSATNEWHLATVCHEPYSYQPWHQHTQLGSHWKPSIPW